MQFGTIQIMVQYSVKGTTFESRMAVIKTLTVMQSFQPLTTVKANTRRTRTVMLPSAGRPKDGTSE
jgi:hypothetical protein